MVTGPRDIIDLEDYPEQTDVVLAAYVNQYEKTGSVQGYKDLADATHLTKDQVRYRIDRLVEDDEVWPQTRESDGKIHFTISQTAANTGRAAKETLEAVPEMSDPPTRTDIYKLMDIIIQSRTTQ